MRNIKIATAQFENHSTDKIYNLSVIQSLSEKAKDEGADVISFHECAITGYSFARKLSHEQITAISEIIPLGESVQTLIKIAWRYDIAILAGLFEKDSSGRLFKAQVCVNKDGMVAKHRKLHPFINPHIEAGEKFTIFKLNHWTCGLLICYDNNIIENVRATALLGAEIIFMPHVTMCTPSPRPGAGFVDPNLWLNRHKEPEAVRAEFDGMKGREWLMKWLPSRACDNGVFVIFSNPIGMDDDQLKNGCSMVIDPFGEVIAECRSLDDEMVIAECEADKIQKSGGFRYRKARRPDLYREILGKEHRAEQNVSWMSEKP